MKTFKVTITEEDGTIRLKDIYVKAEKCIEVVVDESYDEPAMGCTVDNADRTKQIEQ